VRDAPERRANVRLRPCNQCGRCGEDFASLEVFDRHRVGTFDYRFARGLKLEPPKEDGRRCLDVEEMKGRGWRLDSGGRWFDPVRSSRAARAFTPSGGELELVLTGGPS
jgi:hypothetical protein